LASKVAFGLASIVSFQNLREFMRKRPAVPPTVSVDEAAQLLGLTPENIQGLMHQGKLDVDEKGSIALESLARFEVLRTEGRLERKTRVLNNLSASPPTDKRRDGQPSPDQKARSNSQTRKIAPAPTEAARITTRHIRPNSPEDHSDSGETGTNEGQPPVSKKRTSARTNVIFIVHGRNEAIKTQLLLLLERCVRNAKASVLHEQTWQGSTIVEKFERHGATASYAVILATGDDIGGLVGEKPERRARQNVILELGYFAAKLGRERITLLKEPGVEIPSDLVGVGSILLDSPSSIAWKFELLKELADAGFTVDFQKLT
jgi:predicted nucleotide-binding protein